MRLILASRRSALARLQCENVGARLKQIHPNLEVEFHFRESLGDRMQDEPLWKMPEKGVFTEDFIASLRSGEVDAVVHSWKDLPIDDGKAAEFQLAGVLDREDPRDLLLVKVSSLARVQAARRLNVFSSSPRRAFCLEASLGELWPGGLEQVSVVPVRGNIQTRVRKLMEAPEVDALMVAKAALDRLMSAPSEEYGEVQSQIRNDLQQLTWMVLPLSLFPTAPAQGALAVQYASHRQDVAELFLPLRNAEMERHVNFERQRLAAIGGGCHQKLGCSVVAFPQGDFEFYRREIAPNESEHRKEFVSTPPTPATGNVWSTDAWKSFRKNIALPWPKSLLDAQILLVAKATAWPQALEPRAGQIVWTAGVETWKNLARQGIWVHGCADRQGLKLPALPFLQLENPTFKRLTHGGALRGPEDVATYRIEWNESLPEPSEADAYFFGSAFEAREFLKRFQVRQGDRWLCGVGRSFDEIREICPPGVELRAVWSKE